MPGYADAGFLSFSAGAVDILGATQNNPKSRGENQRKGHTGRRDSVKSSARVESVFGRSCWKEIDANLVPMHLSRSGAVYAEPDLGLGRQHRRTR